MANGAQVDYEALAKQAGAIQSQPAPKTGNVDYAALAKQAGALSSQPATQQEQPQPESLWRKLYDSTSVGAMQKLAGHISGWAKQKAEQADAANLRNVAQGGQGNPIEALSPRAGYDLLSHTTGLVSSFLEPQNVAITGGVIAANTNPITGIPVDAALVAHGGYGVAKNAKQALSGNPDAAERALLSASEMAGGAAGTAGQVGAGARMIKSFRNPASAQVAPSSVAGDLVSAPEEAQASGVSPAQANARPASQAPAPRPAPNQAPSASGIARTLGITDPPPNQLLTKAIKPMASNTGWDQAIAKAAPDMKVVEADLGHPITGVDDALNAVSVAKKGIWKQYAAKLQAASAPQVASDLSETAGESASIDGNKIADAMMGSIDKRTALQNPDLVERIQKVANTYRRPMGLDEAEDFLQSANNDLHSYYAKNKVNRQVAERDPAQGYVVAEADQLRDSLYSKLDELTGPGAAELKGRYGALSNVENELLRRKNVSARQQPDSLAEQLSMARAYGKIAVGMARLSPSSMIEGTQSLAAAKWLKTRGTTDAMITRAFEALGRQSAPAAPVPTGAGPTAPAATGAGAGLAAPDETPDKNPGPIASLPNYDSVAARHSFNPLALDVINRLNPAIADSLIKRYGLTDTRKYFKGRNA